MQLHMWTRNCRLPEVHPTQYNHAPCSPPCLLTIQNVHCEKWDKIRAREYSALSHIHTLLLSPHTRRSISLTDHTIQSCAVLSSLPAIKTVCPLWEKVHGQSERESGRTHKHGNTNTLHQAARTPQATIQNKQHKHSPLYVAIPYTGRDERKRAVGKDSSTHGQ